MQNEDDADIHSICHDPPPTKDNIDWLDELADMNCDWDDISTHSTPTLSSSSHEHRDLQTLSNMEFDILPSSTDRQYATSLTEEDFAKVSSPSKITGFALASAKRLKMSNSSSNKIPNSSPTDRMFSTDLTIEDFANLTSPSKRTDTPFTSPTKHGKLQTPTKPDLSFNNEDIMNLSSPTDVNDTTSPLKKFDTAFAPPPNPNTKAQTTQSSSTNITSPSASPPPSPKHHLTRTPFPPLLLPNSPIPGLSAHPHLRTIFSLSLAFTLCHNTPPPILELYCRVLSSTRKPSANNTKEPRIQHFLLVDLRDVEPPFLDAEWRTWEKVRLWEQDGREFLADPGSHGDARGGAEEKGKLCRVVGKMGRVKGKWVLEVESLWRATWEDVEFVAGIHAR